MNPLLYALQAAERYKAQQTTNFLLEIEGAPEIISLNVREVSVGGGSLEVEEIQSGALRFALPRNAEVSRMEITLELDAEGIVFAYFRQWREQVLSKNGYFGLPFGTNGYVRQVKLSSLDEKFRPKKLIRKIQAFPENLGQLPFSHRQAEALEMQITLVQFMPQMGLEDETTTSQDGYY